MNTEQKVARALIEIGAVGFLPESPVTFKSGIISPVYVDNRKFPYYPKEWGIVIEGFKDLIKEKNIVVEVVAGVETGGIPHSAALGFSSGLPSVFVRKEAKEHGQKKMVEGGEIKGKKVILIEDLVSTGLSSLAGVKSLRAEGGEISDCLVIVSYGFREAEEAFKNAKVNLHSLTTFPVILSVAEEMHKLTSREVEKIKEWFLDPRGWAEKYNFK